ncbi:MAG: YCF48-related protein [Candidatus Acidiferrales bacterium]
MPSDDRDQQFDRTLARHLRSASPDAACPDAEILAAYHERSLSLEEMAHWKAHIAACSRCQETLALLEQTDSVAANDWEKEEVQAALRASRSLSGAKDTEKAGTTLAMRAASAAPAPVEIRSASKGATRTRRRVPWSIVVPAGALAAGLLVWVAVHERTNFSMQKDVRVQVAENRETLPPASSTAPQYGKAEARDEGTAALQSKSLADRRPPAALTSPALHAQEPPMSRLAVPSPAVKELGGPERDKLAQLDAEKSLESFQKSAGASSGDVVAKRAMAATPAAPKAAGARGGGPLVANQMQNQVQNQIANQYSNQAPPAPVSQAGNGGANQPADQTKVQAERQPAGEDKKDAQTKLKQENETVTVAGATEAVEVTSAESSATTSNPATTALNRGQVSSLSLLKSNFIAAPDNKHGWRVGPAGKIERSPDAGKSWKTQKSGVTSDLLTGYAPADNVCWIVGKAGALLLTTDGGKHWKQLASPIAEDLGGVRALDAQHASIWDVPRGKTFETSDGGLIWKQVANE